MKKIQIVSILILAITVIIMGINMLVTPFSDWVVRIDGIIMLIALFVIGYSTVKAYMK